MEENYNIIIIGGGPAGLSAAQYAGRANLKTLLVEGTALGGQGLMIESLENYPGLSGAGKGYEFAQTMEQQARQFGAEIIYANVHTLKKIGKLFHVCTNKGDFTASTVILATGAKHRTLDVPGEEVFTGKGVSYCATCDGPFFRNQRILIVGGGDAACDEAMVLSKFSDQIIMVHRRNRFRAQKALAERVITEPKIDVWFNTVVKEIRGEEKVKEVALLDLQTSEIFTEPFGGVFVFVGSLPQTDLVPTLEKDEGGYVITNQRMETSIPGLFAVGDLRSTPFRQVVVAAGEGAIAAHCAAQYIDELHNQAYN